jgi:hypothetical protein
MPDAKLPSRHILIRVGLILGGLALFAAVQQLVLQSVNNYHIVTSPLRIWLAGGDIYASNPDYYHGWDIYKYSPTFVLVFGWLSYLPDELGVILWNLLNAGVLAYGLCRALPEAKWALAATLIIAVEALTAFQNLQSNPALVGLMLLAYADHRDDRPIRAAGWVALATGIKLYGLAVAALFILKPSRWRAYTALGLFIAIWLAVPLIMVNGSLAEWLDLYARWFRVLGAYTSPQQLSAMGLWEAWTGLTLPYRVVQIAALAITLLPIVQRRKWPDEKFRLYLLANLLLFVVLFNQVAESPTYVIALVGVAVYFLASSRQWWHTALLVLVILFTSLGTTDLLPPSARQLWYEPLKLKVLPVLLVWVALNIELWVTFLVGSPDAPPRSPSSEPPTSLH